jgi:hypothetical protein
MHFSDLPLLRRLQYAGGAVVLALLLWAALAPLHYPTRERLFEFPYGAAAAGVAAEVRLTLGVRDVLLLRNRDVAPHVFGQLRVLPGHLVRLPFEQEGSYPFACDVAPGARVRVEVLAAPDPGWERLSWRLRLLLDGVRELPLQGPED